MKDNKILREKKCSRMLEHLRYITEATNEELDESYIDDLLILLGEYCQKIEKVRYARQNVTRTR